MAKVQIKDRIVPFKEFLNNEAAAGVILLFVTILALVLSNLPSTKIFNDFWNLRINGDVGGFQFGFSILHFINDGLMVLFFFIVGLEIKRELLVGELSNVKKALLPIIAALGGIIFPACIYLAINGTGKGHNGWAIPVATDIAFVVGILVFLKNYIPLSLRIFLTALAIVDDIGAVVIIALFYPSEISFSAIKAATLIFSLLMIANLAGVKKLSVYIILGVGLWLSFVYSGIHTTIAGVILAFTIPTKSRLDHTLFLNSAQRLISEISFSNNKTDTNNSSIEKLALIQTLARNCKDVLTPLQRFEINLHPWVTYIIIPLFALANAGVTIGPDFFSYIYDPVCIGIILGLFLGKQFGIFTFTYLAIKTNISEPLFGVSNRQLYGASVLAGIGFTMSLFIANLSFSKDAVLLDTARIGILIASLISGLSGYLLLKKNIKNKRKKMQRVKFNKRNLARFFDF